jgi:hypothetical protein
MRAPAGVHPPSRTGRSASEAPGRGRRRQALPGVDRPSDQVQTLAREEFLACTDNRHAHTRPTAPVATRAMTRAAGV